MINTYVFDQVLPDPETATWEELCNTLTEYFGICYCQRKLKTIVTNLIDIKIKLKNRNFDFTGAEWILIAILDRNTSAVVHGVNCEYPILIDTDPLWIWLEAAKNNINLEDN